MSATCSACGSPLVPGPPREWTGTGGPYTFTVRNLPRLICPAGCDVHRGDTMASLKALLAMSQSLAQELPNKRGFFKKRYVCQACGGSLMEDGADKTFDYTSAVDAGTGDSGLSFEVHIKGPSLTCSACGKKHFPYPDGPDGLSAITRPIVEALENPA